LGAAGGLQKWYVFLSSRPWARQVDDLRQQTTAFFNKMAFEIDVPEPSGADGAANSAAQTAEPSKPRFEPMRRKLLLAVVEDASKRHSVGNV
jgi:hypothetical protein